jgi:hypothetical protein
MTTAHEPLKGRELQKAIIELARRLGWKVAHTPPIATERGWRTAVAADGKGFPDLVLVRDRVIVAEVKGDSDRLRPEQKQWLSAFRMAGIPAHVWTPQSWRSGEIERILKARSQTPTSMVLMSGTGGAVVPLPPIPDDCPYCAPDEACALHV